MHISQNHYEQAFENWLIDNRRQYVPVDQQKRNIFARNKIKSFDFLLYPAGSDPVIAEIKGRKFKGKSLTGLTNLQTWVTMEDIRGLIRWEQVFGEGFQAWFVFAYKIENIDVDHNGTEVYTFDNNQYTFYAVKLDDYRTFMTQRSPKWQTVTLPAAKFREFAVPIKDLLF